MTKIAIACQGGGSQTAFTAGVLISLLKNHDNKKNQFVGLSGTSGILRPSLLRRAEALIAFKQCRQILAAQAIPLSPKTEAFKRQIHKY
ncbi:MAG: hypothetical protein WC799_24995 [Desulfobacteraceae bacterium]|jgi:hypothetical protein